MASPFFDRRAAGAQLARLLKPRPDPVVLGIARGGVVVAASVALALRAPLDMLVVRKVGHPLQPELAIGAVTANGEGVSTPHAAFFPGPLAQILFARARREAQALEHRLRGEIPPLDLAGRNVIVVDDGVATSATMLCALQAARRRQAATVTCAVPVGPVDSLNLLRAHCDDMAVLIAAREVPFAVGRYYFSFNEVSDARVRDELARKT